MALSEESNLICSNYYSRMEQWTLLLMKTNKIQDTSAILEKSSLNEMKYFLPLN